MVKNELLLLDRLLTIQNIIEKNGQDNFYLSYSGGKDSTVLHYLLDEAIPNNTIPRLFINTGIEYKMTVDFVKEMRDDDPRIVIISSGENIKKMLDKHGYPFKSKEHSEKLALYQNGSKCKSLRNYLDKNSKFKCPNILMHQFTPEYSLKVSAQCCHKLKKEPAVKWQKENNKHIVITGMRMAEGGLRANMNCIITDKAGNIKKFHPLAKVTDEWMDWYIDNRNIKLSKLYYQPYNFKRTGCKGCPFSLDLQEQLSVMELYLPDEVKQCETIWQPVYDEYRRLNYRLKRCSSMTQKN